MMVSREPRLGGVVATLVSADGPAGGLGKSWRGSGVS